MLQEFGPKRIFNAPIAEDYIVGTANGMCRFDPKIHVVVEGAEFADYFWPAIEQYVECTHEYWRSNGQFTPNLTLRLASGGYIGGGLYHSQTIEGALTSIPGARIVYPSFADDAAGLLRTSIRSKGFTVFLEPKAQYNSVEAAGFVPEDFEVPFGKARIRRPGSDLSVITYGNTTHFCLSVAERLKKEHNWDVEVIDIRSLIPLDTETIFASVKKTGKVLIVHEDKVFSGFGAEIAGIVGTEMFRYLDAPIQRVGSTFTPVGFHPVLEKAILPGEERTGRGSSAAIMRRSWILKCDFYGFFRSRRAFQSTRPSGRKGTPSPSNRARRSSDCPPPAMEASALPTRCHGSSSGQRRMAQPTIRAARGRPSIWAIWP